MIHAQIPLVKHYEEFPVILLKFLREAFGCFFCDLAQIPFVGHFEHFGGTWALVPAQHVQPWPGVQENVGNDDIKNWE